MAIGAHAMNFLLRVTNCSILLTGNSMMVYFIAAICFISSGVKFTSCLHLGQECILNELYIHSRSLVYSAKFDYIWEFLSSTSQSSSWKWHKSYHRICSLNALILFLLPRKSVNDVQCTINVFWFTGSQSKDRKRLTLRRSTFQCLL